MAKNKYKCILAIDPSGNWNKNEKGGTGLALLSAPEIKPRVLTKTIWAKECSSKQEYYQVIMNLLILPEKDLLVVIEDFRLQFAKAGAQSNSQMQTSELIGRIESFCEEHNIDCVRQQNTVKSRWKDALLKKELMDEFGFDMKKVSRHAKDALRHLMHAYFFTQYKVKNEDN